MIELLPFLVDILDVLLDFYLLFAALESIGEKQLTIQAADLLSLLEQLSVGLGEFFLLEFLLILAFFFIDAPAFKLFFFEFLEALFLLPLFEVLQVVFPLISPLLALLMQIVELTLLWSRCLKVAILVGMRSALIFIRTNSSWVIVIAPFEDIAQLYF